MPECLDARKQAVGDAFAGRAAHLGVDLKFKVQNVHDHGIMTMDMKEYGDEEDGCRRL